MFLNKYFLILFMEFLENKKSFIRTLNFVKINFYILYKRIIEYKTNLWSSFFLESIYLLGMFLFFTVIDSNFSSIINWEKSDYFLYVLLLAIISAIGGLITWKEELFYVLKEGNLNSYLIKPISANIFYTFYRLAPPAMIMIIIDIFFLIFFCIFYNIKLYNIGLGLIIFILIILFNIFVSLFIFSLDLHKMGISPFIHNGFDEIKYSIEQYPAPFFKNSFIKFFGHFISFYYGGLLLIPILRNYPITNLYLHLLVLIILTIIFFTLNWLSWKYGLKKYEAFG